MAIKSIHYYEAKNGVLLDTIDLENCFLVMTGDYRSKDPDGFIKFVQSLEGKTIKKVKTPSMQELVDKKLYTMAMRMHKYSTGCTSQEANEVVRKMVKSGNVPAKPMEQAILKAQEAAAKANAANKHTDA